jgi:hypothetical protein
METGAQGTPSPRDAREALRQLAADESAVRYPPIPRWFFVAMAALIAGVHLAQLLPASDARHATFAVAVAAAVLGARYWLYRDRVSWVSPRFADMVPFLAAVLGTSVLSWLIAAATGAEWVWGIGAAVAAGVVLRTGHRYRQEFGDAG